MWLKTTETYFLEARSLKSVSLDRNQGISRVVLPAQALGRTCPLPLSVVVVAGVLGYGCDL